MRARGGRCRSSSADEARRHRGDPRALLTGLAVCGVCGATVHAGGAKPARGYRIYRCSGSPGYISRKADPINEYVEAVALGQLARSDAAELLADRERPDLDATRDEAESVRRRLDGLADAYADGSVTLAQLQRATATLRGRLVDIEAAMADAGRLDVLGPLVTAADVAAVLAELGTDQRRRRRAHERHGRAGGSRCQDFRPRQRRNHMEGCRSVTRTTVDLVCTGRDRHEVRTLQTWDWIDGDGWLPLRATDHYWVAAACRPAAQPPAFPSRPA
jgi:hypothetical protein